MAVGATQVEAGNTRAYQQLKNHSIANYTNSTDYIFSAIVLKSCLLAPAGPEDLAGLQPLADLVENKLTSASPDAVNAQLAFAAMSMALMEYRKGNFSVAQEWCRKCLDFPNSNDARSVTVHAIGAMAARKLGQSELAGSELARSKELSRWTVGPDPVPFQGRGQGYWQDCAIARILLREAEEAEN